MLSCIYYFEQIDGIYKQYPIDYTQVLFKEEIISKVVSSAQLITHRHKSLIYYTYIKKVDAGIIGGCFVLNNVMLSEIKPVFECFENLLYKWYNNGFLSYIEDSLSYRLIENEEKAIEEIATFISPLETLYIPLPPLSYGKGYQLSVFMIDDEAERIKQGICLDNFCIIKKEHEAKWFIDKIVEEKDRQLILQKNEYEEQIDDFKLDIEKEIQVCKEVNLEDDNKNAKQRSVLFYIFLILSFMIGGIIGVAIFLLGYKVYKNLN